MTYQIVLAKVIEEARVVAGSKVPRVDLGERHSMETYRRPVAMMWLARGGDSDAAKARAYAAGEGYGVLIYPSTERDPLGRAKAEIMGR